MRILLALAILAACAVPPVQADMGIQVGAALEYFTPLQTEMWGGAMASNSWGRDIAGIEYSTGTARNQFYTYNRYDRMIVPALRQALHWDNGFAVELSESWLWLSWAPNKDVDILYDRVMVPIRLAAKYRFFPTGNFHPTVAAGGGMHYVSTVISGTDLYDQRRNPNYESEGQPEGETDETIPAPRQYFRDQRRFAQSVWAPGWHVAAGFEAELSYPISVFLEFRYWSVPMDTIDAVRVREGNAQDWHWEERDVSGDAGGLTGLVGIAYLFLP
ncbi:MAG: hypothetical protein M5R36_18850 [Deltaproteobacteria bacterium]|nr:hypothetical protein [Deltaproteobacteria bacterium]